MLISQDHPHVERFVRQPSGGWLLLEETSPTGKFDLDSLGISISMAELYRGVKFGSSGDEPFT